MLDLIEYRMHKGQVGCRKLSGHLSVDKREEASASVRTLPPHAVFALVADGFLFSHGEAREFAKPSTLFYSGDEKARLCCLPPSSSMTVSF